MITGINLGSGEGWSLIGWKGFDKIDGQFLDENTVLPFKDGTIEHVYSSHFFEHVNDATATNLFQECYRIMRPHGTMRIVVPHFGRLLQKYRDGDEHWFRKVVHAPNFEPRPDWAKYKVRDTLANLLMNWIANYDFNGPKGFYRGPPINVTEDEVKEKANACDLQQFCEWAQSLDADNPKVLHNHINWYDVAKFQHVLGEIGFKHIQEREYMRSSSRTFMKTGMFDSWKPNRKPHSLYIEATR